MSILWHSLWQGVGKSTLAKKIAASWKCVLIDGKYSCCISGLCPSMRYEIFLTSCHNISDTDLLDTHIKNKTKEGIEVSVIFYVTGQNG